MTDTVDLFKFVSLRSPEALTEGPPDRTVITDPRVLRVVRYPRPDVTTDTADFAASPAATAIHAAVAAQVALLPSSAGVAAANRAISADFALGNLSPAASTVTRLDALRRSIEGADPATPRELLEAAQAAFEHLGAGETVEHYVFGTGLSVNGTPPMPGATLDRNESFDALYRAYVAKQVRPINLELYFTALRIVASIQGAALGAVPAGSPVTTPAGVIPISTQPELKERLTATPVVHPMFGLLVGYYRPVNPIQPVGIGDLLVVKQQLVGYQDGEVAHVENVLLGEHKSTTHRVLDRMEETVSLESESTEETLRELQSTERFELKAETESTIKNDLDVEVSGQLSGRYGVVEVSASAGVSYSLSTSDSRRSSNNFAKDVIDRSLSRIQKRVKEERTTRRLHEVEETNVHEVDNRVGTGHISGIYRWVDKKYRAQVYNYGKRLMFEFVIPEPAAFVIDAFERNRNLEGPPDRPQPPAKPTLILSQISQATVDTYANIYPLGDVRPQPAESMTVTKVLTGSGLASETATSHEKQFDIPEGYLVTSASISGAYEGVNVAGQGNDWGVNVALGGQTTSATHPASGGADYHQQISQRTLTFTPSLTGTVSASVVAYRVHAFEVTVALSLKVSDSTKRAWQVHVYDTIMDAYGRVVSEYQSQLTEYRDRMSGFRVGQGVVIRGRNPRVNQEVIRAELKKSCLAMVALQFDTDRSDDVVFDAMKARRESIAQTAVLRTQKTTETTSTTSPGVTVKVTTTTLSDDVTTTQAPIDVPAIDVTEATEEGRLVQFLEQAFEWQQITYVLYPYFWGRLPQKWYDAQRYYDEEDPLFARFLQAGAARVLVAARPGFEMAVLHYLATRQPWNGGPTPGLDDPSYLAVHEELRDQQDDLNEAQPYGTSWSVVVPTSLVHLQQDSALPVFSLPSDDVTP